MLKLNGRPNPQHHQLKQIQCGREDFSCRHIHSTPISFAEEEDINDALADTSRATAEKTRRRLRPQRACNACQRKKRKDFPLENHVQLTYLTSQVYDRSSSALTSRHS